MKPLLIHPEVWLVSSRDIFESLRASWLPTVPPDSLLALRMRRGAIRHCPREAWSSEIPVLRSAGFGAVHFVVERLEASILEALASGAEGARVHQWRHGVLDVVEAMCCPEDALLTAWRQSRNMPREITFPAVAQSAGWTVPEYLDAVGVWERLARSGSPEMAELYDPEPGLVEWLRSPVRAGNLKDQDAQFELTAATLPINESPGTWYTKDRSLKLDVSATGDANVLRVVITLDCSSGLAATLTEVELDLEDRFDVVIGAGTGSLDWKEAGGKAVLVADVAGNAEKGPQVPTGPPGAVVRVRKGG